MFINIFNKHTFKQLKRSILIFAFIGFIVPAFSQVLVKGLILDADSINVMPFVYIINKSNGNGTMSDNDGKFSLYSKSEDTLVCTFIGYKKLFIPIKDLVFDSKGDVKLIMQKNFVNLGMITVSSFKIKPYERDYMRKIIDESLIRKMDYAMSPISALYMTYSKEGKQIRKLARIFEDLLIEEEVQKKLSPEILRQLTGDDKIDYAAFRKYCVNVSNYFIINHEGVELYSKVMECYRKFKSEGRTR